MTKKIFFLTLQLLLDILNNIIQLILNSDRRKLFECNIEIFYFPKLQETI